MHVMFQVKRVAVLLAIGAVGSVTTASAAPVDDIIATMPAATWYEFPNSKLESVAASPTPEGGEGIRSVMYSWSGGTYDTKRERLLVWGGGHTAYAGNEIYAFNLNAATPQWTMASDPSSSFGGDVSSELYPDGKPRSRHTHNYIAYVPNVDKFMSFGSYALYPVSASGPKVVAYDFDSASWDTSTLPDIPYANYISGSWTGENVGSNAVYDPVTSSVWYLRATELGRLFRYDPANKKWYAYAASNTYIYNTAAIDPERRIIVTVGCSYCSAIGNKQIKVWDLNNPDVPPYTPNTSGDKTLEGAQGPGFEYDDKLKKFVGWNGGADVYVLSPPAGDLKTGTWEWTKVSAGPSNTVTPTAGNARGTYGRFRYVPSKNVYIGVNATSENVYMLKLTDGSGVAQWPIISISATDTDVTVGSSVNISWTTTNATSCSASGDWSGAKAVSAGGQAVVETVGPINTTSNYTLNCSGPGGSVSTSVQVVVSSTGGSGISNPSGSGAPTSANAGSGGGGTINPFSLLMFVMFMFIYRRFSKTGIHLLQ